MRHHCIIYFLFLVLPYGIFGDLSIEKEDSSEVFGNVIVETGNDVQNLPSGNPGTPGNPPDVPPEKPVVSEKHFITDVAFGKFRQYLTDLKTFFTGGSQSEDERWENGSEGVVDNPDQKTAPEVNSSAPSTDVKSGNASSTENGTVATGTTFPKINRVNCLDRNLTEKNEVKIVNSSLLLQSVLPEVNKTLSLQCVVVLFYAPWCPFSAMAAPHFNALPRAYPSIDFLAVNAMAQGSLNTRYGIVAIPSMMLFHGGRAVAKYNDTSYIIEKYSSFLVKYTGLQAAEPLNVTDTDMEGPLPTVVTRETDYILWLAWLFILLCSLVGFTKSSLFKSALETIRSNWREAEAQHDHAD